MRDRVARQRACISEWALEMLEENQGEVGVSAWRAGFCIRLQVGA